MADIEEPVIADPWDKDGLALDRLDPLPTLPHRYPDGWMRPIELRILYTLARRAEGPVLEVGPWIGRSTSAIAAGLRDGSRQPAPIFDLVDFGPCSAAEWKERFGQPLRLDMAGGIVASAVFHPGGSIAVLIDNLRRNDLLGNVTSIVRGDLLEVPLGRRYGMIFCDAVHGEVEAARTMPRIAELVADDCLLVFDDVTTEAFADVICGYLKPARRFLLSSKDRYGKLLVVEHRASRAAAAPVRPKPRAAAPPDAAAARQTAATEVWRNAFREHGIDHSVLIASTFRSGSTYVSELLDRNGMPGLGVERFANSWRFAATPPGEAFSAFLGETLAEARAGCFTTKLMWPHLARLAEAMGYARDDAGALAGLFAPAQWVQVARADKFDQAISFWRAKTSGRWHVYARDTEAEPALDYDFFGIWDALHEIELHDRLWDDFFSRAGITPIRVTYEDIEADPAGGTARLLAGLGLPADAPATEVPLRRQRDTHSATLRERFIADLYRV